MVQKNLLWRRRTRLRPFFRKDSGFRVIRNSGFLSKTDSQESPNGHGHPSVCPSDVSDSCPKSSNVVLSGEYFQHAPSSWTRVGETSNGDDARHEHHVHGLHPCAHPCCQGTGTSNFGGLVCGVARVILEGSLVQALLFFRRGEHLSGSLSCSVGGGTLASWRSLVYWGTRSSAWRS